MPPSEAKAFSGIFVSYHRDDSFGHAGRLFDRLSEHFGEPQIFMDVERMQAGEDFVEAIVNAVGSCEILIAIIGRRWLSKSDESSRRLDNPIDYVRLEIATAFDRDLRVVPVLVDGAVMPQAPDLPNDLAKLPRLQALELSYPRWNRDVDHLIADLERIFVQREEARSRAAAEEEERQRREAESLRVVQELRLAEATRQVEEESARKDQSTTQQNNASFMSGANSEPFIFVSYARDDSYFVYPEIERLKASGYSIRYDKEQIRAGRPWSDEINEAMKACSCFLVFITQRSLESDRVVAEIMQAFLMNKPSIAVYWHKVVLPLYVQEQLQRIQGLEVYTLDRRAYESMLDSALSESVAPNGKRVFDAYQVAIRGYLYRMDEPDTRTYAQWLTMGVLKKLDLKLKRDLLVFLFRYGLLREDARLTLQDADFRGVDLASINLPLADLDGINLERAILRDAGLFKANLQNARLKNADLSRAHLEKADLREADLTGAVLEGTILTGANLTGTELNPEQRHLVRL